MCAHKFQTRNAVKDTESKTMATTRNGPSPSSAIGMPKTAQISSSSANELAALMGAEIGYARRHGVVLYPHISDDTVQRLQAARVARQYSTTDDVTIDVDSPEEAARAYAKYLGDPRFSGSIRAALSLVPA
jgi:hypothetical protein